MKTPRSKTKRFEVKRVTLTTFITVHADESVDFGYASEFSIPDEDDYNDKIYDGVRDFVGGPVEVVKGRDDKTDFAMLVNGNGRRFGLQMNNRASELRYQWLAKHRRHLSVEECEYHCLIVGDVILENPKRGFVIINRDLDQNEIEARLANLKFDHLTKVMGNRVYCLEQADATAISLAIRTEKAVA